ncbi:hypothetical protein D478_11412 [Brevibacillus agri BAB-2500]|nr:hypothetical protein D478_11412 [Brevibacillus agri BAB-2500]
MQQVRAQATRQRFEGEQPFCICGRSLRSYHLMLKIIINHNGGISAKGRWQPAMQSKQGSEKRGTVSWQGLWMKLRHSEQIMVKQDVPHAGQGCIDKHRLIVALDGSGSIEIDASCYPVKEGEAWLLLPGQSCSFYIESSRKLTCHALAFDVYREAESEDGEAITLHRTTLPFAGRVTCLSQPTLRMRCGSIGEAWEQTDARTDAASGADVRAAA